MVHVDPLDFIDLPEMSPFEESDDDDLPMDRPALVNYPAETPFSAEEYSDEESSEGTLIFMQSPSVYDESPEYGVLDFFNVLGESSDNEENDDYTVEPFTFNNLPEINPFEESDDDDLPMDRPALVSYPAEIIFFSDKEDSDFDESSEDHSMVHVDPLDFIPDLPEISPFEESDDDYDLPMDRPALVSYPGEIVLFSAEEH